MTTKLSPLDLYLPDVHSHEILCFQTDSSHSRTQQVLASSLQKAIEQFPLLASSLVLDAETSLPVISPPHRATRDILTFYDLSERLSYASLQHVDFQLDECSPTTASLVEFLSLNRPQPNGLCNKGRTNVFAATVVLVEGGVVLAVFVNHMAVDAVGLGIILRMWADCCAGGVLEYSVSSEREGVAERLGIQEKVLGEELRESRMRMRIGQEQEQEEIIGRPTLAMPGELDQIMLHLTASALADLKATLNKELELRSSPHARHYSTTRPPQLTLITTNSALTALLWCTITACRPQSKNNSRLVTSVTVPVNLRPRLTPPLPPSYIGNAVGAASPSASHELVVRGATDIKALAQVAQVVQEAVCAVDGDYVRRCFEQQGSDGYDCHHNGNSDELDADASNSNAKSLELRTCHKCYNSTSIDNPPLSLFGTPTTAFTINSWATQSLYAHTWGPDLGTVQHMMRLKSAAEVVLILPKLPNGDVEVQMPLEKETCKVLHNYAMNGWEGDGDKSAYLMAKWASVLGGSCEGKKRERRDSGVGWLEWVGWRRGRRTSAAS